MQPVYSLLFLQRDRAKLYFSHAILHSQSDDPLWEARDGIRFREVFRFYQGHRPTEVPATAVASGADLGPHQHGWRMGKRSEKLFFFGDILQILGLFPHGGQYLR